MYIQTIIAETAAGDDAPLQADTREERHIIIDEPYGVRHSSDTHRYLINRHVQIGGHEIMLADIEADTYYDNETGSIIPHALFELEDQYNESPISRRRLLRITRLLEKVVWGRIEDRALSTNNLITLGYANANRMRNSLATRSSEAEEATNKGPDNDDDVYKEIGELSSTSSRLKHANTLNLEAEIGTFLADGQHQTRMNEMMLCCLEDIQIGKYRSIAEAMRAHGLLLKKDPNSVVTTPASTEDETLDMILEQSSLLS